VVLLFPAVISAQSVSEAFKRGVQSHLKGDLAAAERYYHQTIDADPNHYDAHHSLGTVFAAQQRWKEAEAEFRRALSIKPDEGRARESLIHLLIDSGRFDGAIVEARQLVATADTLQNRRLLGRAYLSGGRTAEACAENQRAFAFEPLNSPLQLELAECWMRNQDFDAALMHANAVVKREPANQIGIALIATIRSQQRARAWVWFPIILTLGASCAALGARQPKHWAHRRIALGIVAWSVSWAVWLGGGEGIWVAGSLWGTYQFYAAFAHRRMKDASASTHGAFLSTAARVLACVCLADGEMRDAELRWIRSMYEQRSFGESDLALVGKELRRCTDVFRSKLFDHQALYAELHAACTEFCRLSNEAMRLDLFRSAVNVAVCDAPATPGELRIVQACATWLNITVEMQDEIWKQAVLQSNPVHRT